MSEQFPAPEITELNAPYWDALTAGNLIFQRCSSCANAWLPARAECPRCLSGDCSWDAASGRGRLISWTIYHIAYHEAFRDRLPYNVAVVELDEGPRLITNIINPYDQGGLVIDKSVSFVADNNDGIALARFELIDGP